MQHSDVELNFVENEGERRRGSLLSAVGLWVRGPIETFLSGLLGQQWSSDLSLCQLKVDMPPSTTLESDFTNSEVSTGALKKLNSLAGFTYQHSFSNKKIVSEIYKAKGQVRFCTVSKHKELCLLNQLKSGAAVLCRHICPHLSVPHPPPLSLIKPRCANTKVYLGLINDNR